MPVACAAAALAVVWAAGPGAGAARAGTVVDIIRSPDPALEDLTQDLLEELSHMAGDLSSILPSPLPSVVQTTIPSIAQSVLPAPAPAPTGDPGSSKTPAVPNGLTTPVSPVEPTTAPAGDSIPPAGGSRGERTRPSPAGAVSLVTLASRAGALARPMALPLSLTGAALIALAVASHGPGRLKKVGAGREWLGGRETWRL